MKLNRLFYTPLVTFEVAGSEALNAALLEEAEALQRDSAGIARSNSGGWHSTSQFLDSDGPAIRRLRDAVRHNCAAATQAIDPGFDETGFSAKMESWLNVNPTGALNVPHVHPGYLWSGCYYVAQPPQDGLRSGCIEFISPRGGQSPPPGIDARCFKLKHRVRPRPGQMLVFPASLTHWVYPNRSEAERVTVAFNLRYRKAPKP